MNVAHRNSSFPDTTNPTRSSLRSRSHRRRACPRRGLSLVEVVVSTMLVGLIIIASLKSIGAVFRTHAIAAKLNDADACAQDLMNEIVQSWYEDPEVPGSFGVEPGEATSTRLDFDDIDDFDGWTSTPPVSRDGTPMPGYTGWTRQVDVDWAPTSDIFAVSPTETYFKRITVHVTSPTAAQTTLHAFRFRDGALSQKIGGQGVCVTKTTAELQLGTGAATLGSTMHANHAIDE